MKPGDMFRYIDGSTGLIVSEPFLWRIDLTKKEEEATLSIPRDAPGADSPSHKQGSSEVHGRGSLTTL